jgi:hypothetical protein
MNHINQTDIFYLYIDKIYRGVKLLFKYIGKTINSTHKCNFSEGANSHKIFY